MSMKKLSLIALFCLGLSVTSAEAAIIKVKVTNKKGDTVILILNSNERKDIVLDANGLGSIEIKDFEPQYAVLRYEYGRRILYLEPDKDLTLSFDGKTMWKTITIEGTGAAINNYLNDGKLAVVDYEDAKLSEAAYIKKSDSVYNANVGAFTAAKLPAAFAGQEEKRLKYVSYANYPLYPSFHGRITKNKEFQLTDAYYEHLKELTTLDADLLSMTEYKEFLPEAIARLSVQGKKVAKRTDNVNYQLEYINANVSDSKLKEFLTNNLVYGYVESNGVTGAEGFIAEYKKNVQDPELIKAFDGICTKWSKITVGQPSPEFQGENMEGKVVTLKDLKGKYVYIDIWATWCGPCRAEIPHLKKLEEKYHGKDIEFVSLSCDQDKDAWKKMVEKDQLKGVQLHIGNKSSFMDDYLVLGIPRFILLDKDGKIISSDMSRPSNAGTVEKFDELLGL